ncbi:MAG: ZIP family metal transporter [bacterium]|nr:ZIP family metal transporter [bacterium]
MDLVATKLVLAAAVLLVGWLGGAVVLGRTSESRDSRVLSWGNAFAAGVFLGTGLIHTLGEASGLWRDLGWDYPVAFVLAAAAFCLILLFEHVLLPDEAHAMIHAHTGDPLEHDGHHHHEPGQAARDTSPIALVVALSAHSVVAGLALGAQRLMASTLMIALAILAHKATAGLALGITLARRGTEKKRSRRYLMLFALMTPLGILVGLVGSGLLRQGADLYFDATVSALAAGTFLYIASIDMLQDEFLQPGSRWAKWVSAVSGLAITAVLALWV